MDVYNAEILATIVNNSTVSPPDQLAPQWIGYIAVLISVVFFGSNFVPAAKYDIKDGLSFQFFLCCGIWATSVVINLAVGSPPVFSLVLIGGVLWTTGNILSVYVITINGLGISMLLWCTSNLLMGWASGHFGWFGLLPEDVEKPAFNYIGVVIAVLSGVLFLALRSEKGEENIEERKPLLQPDDSSVVNIPADDAFTVPTSPPTPTVSMRMRIIGFILAIVSGLFFGLVFTPVTYIQDHRTEKKYAGASNNGLHYVFALYTGILLASTVYYSIYIMVKRNRPHVCIESILPAFISGVMWGIAEAGFIVANSILSQAITFPLISIGPSTLAVLWSIFYFKDIRGSRNYLIFIIGTVIRVVASVLIILSKPKAR